MKRVYTAGSPQEAYLIKGLLQESGIEAFVEGEHRGWLLGGVPLSETYPWVCVEHDEDAEAAQELIAAWATTQLPDDDSASSGNNGKD